jgi:hypothetical protein
LILYSGGCSGNIWYKIGGVVSPLKHYLKSHCFTKGVGAETSTKDYSNRESIPFDKWRRMHFFLDDPTLKPTDQADWNLKFRALAEFELVDGRLHRKANDVYKLLRYYMSENEGFNYIVQEHMRLKHLGRDKE